MSLQSQLDAALKEVSKFNKLYHKVNLMVAELGANGEIDTRHNSVLAVMSVLNEIDGGIYTPEANQ